MISDIIDWTFSETEFLFGDAEEDKAVLVLELVYFKLPIIFSTGDFEIPVDILKVGFVRLCDCTVII